MEVGVLRRWLSSPRGYSGIAREQIPVRIVDQCDKMLERYFYDETIADIASECEGVNVVVEFNRKAYATADLLFILRDHRGKPFGDIHFTTQTLTPGDATSIAPQKLTPQFKRAVEQIYRLAHQNVAVHLI